MWHSKIHGMLRRIPSISPEGLQSYFRSIDAKLSVYDELKDAPALLELASGNRKLTNELTGTSTFSRRHEDGMSNRLFID
jgi:hypothetical protein